MNKRTHPSSHQSSVWLHLVLVAGVVVYLYSPFIDHWFGFATQSRPHTHITINIPHETLSDHEDHEHESSSLCLLNIDAALTLLFGFYSIPALVTPPQTTLSFARDAAYIHIATISPTVLTPPPNLHTQQSF